MKTYKLIKKYPGSFEIGHLAKLDKSKKYYDLGTTTRAIDYIENNPTHWQQVCPECLINIMTCNTFGCKKDYEILNFITKGKVVYKKGIDNYFFNEVQYAKWTEEELLTTTDFAIHSVKRLSDGEIFTIGDLIDLKNTFRFAVNNKSDKISEIKIIDNKIRFKMNFQLNHRWDSSYTLDFLTKIKQPIFTTEDGVDIFKGDPVYYVFNELTPSENAGFTNKWKIRITLAKDIIINNESVYYKVFSTEKAAKNYIKMNKPCLSLQEIKDVFEKDVLLTTPKLKVVRTLEKIVKQKLK